jgi:hypothetical protein
VQFRFFVRFLGENGFSVASKLPPEIPICGSKNRPLCLLPQRGTFLDNPLKRRAFRPATAATRKDGR